MDMTVEEKLLLSFLKEGPRSDHDRTAERALIGMGLAERTNHGMIQITTDGRARASALDL